jgi:hypothetical protein
MRGGTNNRIKDGAIATLANNVLREARRVNKAKGAR